MLFTNPLGGEEIQNEVNTSNTLQKKGPLFCFSPSWGIFCREENDETEHTSRIVISQNSWWIGNW